MSTRSGRWDAVSASVRGASHERSGKPNQDAVRVVAVDGPVTGLVAAVCDGHGGDRYVRSDVGARLGVEVACAVGRHALGELGPTPDGMAIESVLRTSVATSIVDRWRDRVSDDVAARPFTADERERVGAGIEDDPLVSYGCTLVLAILAPSWVGLLQIGDGDLTLVRGTRAESPVPGDDRLVGGETTSLCLSTAAADARVSALIEPLPELVILTSDGYANSFASPTWRTDVGVDLRDHVRRIGLDEVESRLPAWLSDSAEAGGDDVTMALVLRSDAFDMVHHGAKPSDRMVGVPTSTAGRVVRAAVRRRVLASAAIVLAVLAGGAGGWVLAQADRAPAAPAGTSLPVVAPGDTNPDETAPAAERLPDTPTTDIPTTVPSPIEPSVTAPPSTPGLTSPPVETSAPPTSVVAPAATTLPVLTDADEVHLLIGAGEGIIVAFDSDASTPAIARSFGWVALEGVSAPLADGWTFDLGELAWRGDTRSQAVAVLTTQWYMWAVGTDRRTLTSYDVVNGEWSGSSTIVDFTENHAEQTDGGRPSQGG